MRFLALMATVVLLTSHLRADDAVMSMERKAMAGKWKLVALEDSGCRVTNFAPVTLVIERDGRMIQLTERKTFRYRLRIDPRQHPKTMDCVFESASDGRNQGDKGKVGYGIYKLQGDKLIICQGLVGVQKTRPKVFSTKGTSYMLAILVRVRETRTPK